MSAHELVLEMKKLRKEYDKKPKKEQVKIAHDALVKSGMIDSNGNFTENYAYSREFYEKTKKKDRNSEESLP